MHRLSDSLGSDCELADRHLSGVCLLVYSVQCVEDVSADPVLHDAEQVRYGGGEEGGFLCL